MKKKLYIVDGHALCYRAYYAFISKPLTNSKGENISAIFGFFRMLFKLIETQKPDYMAVAFDPPKKTFRFDIYEEYKANRQKMPDDLRSQINSIQEIVKELGLPVVMNDGYEADDVLGTVAAKFSSDDMQVILVTGDKDAYQLINENVSVYANTKGISEYIIYDREKVVEKLGITPEQVIDYMAMVGDSADNIPGIKGIGPKSALKLITDFKSLDGIYENIDQLKGKQKEKVESARDMAYLSKDLVTIRTDIELNATVEDMEYNDIGHDIGGEIFTSLEMKSIVEEYFSGYESVPETNPHEEMEKDYQLVKDLKTLEAVLSEIKQKKLVSVDTETTSINPNNADIVGMSFSIKEGQGWYIPLINNSLFNEDQIQFTPDEALKMVKPIIEDPEIKKIGQNIKYDIIVFSNSDIHLQGLHFDTMVADYLLAPSVRRHNMDDMAMYHLNYKTIKFKELVGTGKKAIPITEVPLADLAEYAIEDTDITLRLYNILKDRLKKNNLEKLFYDMEIPLIFVLAHIEKNGVRIDPDYFHKLGVENEKRLKVVESNIYELAEEEFNINSTRELARILFEKLGLTPVKKTKTGYSTDISVLEELKGHHDIIENLISYRTLNKLKNTYIDTLPKLILSRTGNIHTSYNQTVAATGRLSSTDPNLQNIPIKDDFGKNIRKGFVARDESWSIMSADYSQIELRLAAHISGDENMIRAFKEGIDIHNMTASSVFGVDIDKIEPWMRRQSKIINFATIYGVSPYGLSQQADISMSDAKVFIEKYFETYPGMKNYISEMTDFAEEHGYVETLWGRKRFVPGIHEKNKNIRESAIRVAINTPVQGTSADMIKIAMINIENEFKSLNLKSRMIMQVHDELVFEVSEDEKSQVEQIVRDKMENVKELQVPIEVSVGWGKNWEEAH